MGKILREDILPETGLSAAAAAKALGVSRQMVHEKSRYPLKCARRSPACLEARRDSVHPINSAAP